MIRRKAASWEVVVFAGRDPVTGRERRVSRSVPATGNGTRPPKAARDLEAKLRHEVTQGLHGSPHVTVGDLLDAWLAHARPNLEESTIVGYERVIRCQVRPHLGKVRLEKLSTATLDRLYRSLAETGGTDGGPLAPSTVRQCHAVLRRALSRAVSWGWVARNVAVDAEPPRLAKKKRPKPTPEQMRAALAASDAESVDLGDQVHLAACGLRRAEVSGLRWCDLDLDAEPDPLATVEITVVEIAHRLIVKAPKTDGSARTIPLPGFVAERLRARRKRAVGDALACGASLPDTGYVLSESPDGSTPLHPNLASDRFRRMARRAGLPLRLHDLRHGLVTLALHLDGVEPSDVSDYAGHDSTRMTLDVYGAGVPEGLRRIARGVDAALG